VVSAHTFFSTSPSSAFAEFSKLTFHAGYFFEGMNGFQHECLPRPVPQVESLRNFVCSFCCNKRFPSATHVGFGNVDYVNVIADTGAIGSVVIIGEYRQGFTDSPAADWSNQTGTKVVRSSSADIRTISPQGMSPGRI
jgi:hypothetical protein